MPCRGGTRGNAVTARQDPGLPVKKPGFPALPSGPGAPGHRRGCRMCAGGGRRVAAKPSYDLKSCLFPVVNAEERPALQGGSGGERWHSRREWHLQGLLKDRPAPLCPAGRLSDGLLRPGMANPAFLNFKSPVRSCPFDSGCVRESLGEPRFLRGEENEGGPGE